MAVNGRTWVVQWRKPRGAKIESSPIAIGTVVTAILVIAGIIALAYLARELTFTIKETTRLVSVIGRENITMILNIVTMMMTLMFVSAMMGIIARIPVFARRRE